MTPTRLYHNKASCSKLQATRALVESRGVHPELVDLTSEPPSPSELRALLGLLGLPARDLLRTGEAAFSNLGLDDPSLGDDALVDAMCRHSELIERPILVHDGRAVLARPPERVLDLLG